jgi:hypothetical protein
MCLLCQSALAGDGVSLFTAKRAGEAGRNGNTVGPYVCAALACSHRVRTDIPPWLRERDPAEVIAERASELLERCSRSPMRSAADVVLAQREESPARVLTRVPSHRNHAASRRAFDQFHPSAICRNETLLYRCGVSRRASARPVGTLATCRPTLAPPVRADAGPGSRGPGRVQVRPGLQPAGTRFRLVPGPVEPSVGAPPPSLSQLASRSASPDAADTPRRWRVSRPTRPSRPRPRRRRRRPPPRPLPQRR